jgi:hypothetical protein
VPTRAGSDSNDTSLVFALSTPRLRHICRLRCDPLPGTGPRDRDSARHSLRRDGERQNEINKVKQQRANRRSTSNVVYVTTSFSANVLFFFPPPPPPPLHLLLFHSPPPPHRRHHPASLLFLEPDECKIFSRTSKTRPVHKRAYTW